MCDQHKFVFEFDKAYNSQLVEKFEASPEHALTEDVAPPDAGVYALYRNGKLVYTGRALQRMTLRRRLAEHARKIDSRQNIHLGEMSCRFLVIEGSWFVRAAEDALINYYTPEWNRSGVGGHVPGIGRPGKYVSKWDSDFPPRQGYVKRKRGKKSPPES